MATHTFTIVLGRAPSDDELDRLFEAGFDDAVFGIDHGQPFVTLDREAEHFAAAFVAAVRGLDAAGLMPLRVVDEDLVTLADIADRVGQSRESVRRYTTGERGTGGFPPPANPGRDGTVFYRWSEVAPWVKTHLGIEVTETPLELVLANLILQARPLVTKVANVPTLTGLLAA